MEINNKSIVTGQRQNLFSYSGWPSVCVDENGVLYAVCSGHRMGHVCPFGKTYMYKSRDNGKTWSVPSIIDDSFLDDRDAGILYLGRGRMIVTNFSHPISVYKQNYKDWVEQSSGRFGVEMLNLTLDLPQEETKGGSFYKVSEDYGETWSERKLIPISTPHGPILLNDGNILYLGKEMYSYGAEEEGTISTYISAPSPIEFKKYSDCPRPAEYEWNRFDEPYCIQLDSGRILALYRAQIKENGNDFTIFKTISDDNGKTWSTPEETGICGSPPHLLKLKDGRALLTYGRRMRPFGIYGRIVEKDGTITDNEILIDEAADSDIGYPASAELENGDIVTVFYKREISDRFTSIVSVNYTLNR